MNYTDSYELCQINHYTLGEKVRWLREHKTTDQTSRKGYMTSEALAKEIGIGAATLNSIENNKDCKLSTITEIAEYFDVSIDWLCSRSTVNTHDYDTNFICDYTGLSEHTVEYLHADIPASFINSVASGNILSCLFFDALFFLEETYAKSIENSAEIIQSKEIDRILSQNKKPSKKDKAFLERILEKAYDLDEELEFATYKLQKLFPDIVRQYLLKSFDWNKLDDDIIAEFDLIEIEEVSKVKVSEISRKVYQH